VISKQDEHTAAEVAAQDEDQAAAGAGNVPDDLAAAQQRLAEARAEAEQARTQADEVEAMGEAEAARIRQETRTEAQRLRWTVAPAADRKAEAEQLFIGHVTEARNRDTQARQEAETAQGLAAEHDSLLEQIAAKDEKLAELGQQRQDAHGSLSAAEEQVNVAAIQDAAALIATLDRAMAAVTRQREPLQARLTAIGDQDGPGLLYDALRAFRAHSEASRKAVNLAFPDSEQARRARALAEFQSALEGNLARIAEEANARPGQTSVQHVGNTALVQRR